MGGACDEHGICGDTLFYPRVHHGGSPGRGAPQCRLIKPECTATDVGATRLSRTCTRLGGQQPVSTQSSAAGANSTFTEIRLFFRRGFIELLLPDGSALTPEGMLEILERRLQTAMEADTEWMQQQKEMQADAASAHTSA